METKLEKGMKAPDFSLKNSEGKKVTLADFKGKTLVLYFYPKDNTPGCTQEAIDFSEMIGDFKMNNVVIVGVSPDDEQSHAGFISKQNLKVELLADPDHKALEAYGVWQLKKNYGKEYMGVVRTTFLIDPKGVIAEIWDKVKVEGHVETVLKTACSLLK
ncbi:MAG: thioredoxin-dependent thiol peroxidase [Fibrobacteres bacterium]|nr:thioredoxin-dependent thiol peroxidase [Fibrobacterota bacterium]